jgi:hypothetical protein
MPPGPSPLPEVLSVTQIMAAPYIFHSVLFASMLVFCLFISFFFMPFSKALYTNSQNGTQDLDPYQTGDWLMMEVNLDSVPRTAHFFRRTKDSSTWTQQKRYFTGVPQSVRIVVCSSLSPFTVTPRILLSDFIV